ncbi:AGAP011495-PA-like protein [Anopheles sinensis]|uniref:AGAP011495-PA-like protein n=1 Tax=Anopheles sinensis TaxID=74873 RepID=A0A084WB93_ANOSI|nr:AGAP011495-PA-like protein [Anopheles sinensis]
MEEAQQQPLRPSFPPAGAKWPFNASGGEGGNSFGQDSGYTSYHSTTPNNTFNLSTRHGASVTLATIDEANEGDCSMNDSGGSSALGPIGSAILTPKTAASIDQISNFHLTTPESVPMRPNRRLRRGPFDFSDCTGGGAGGSSESSFLAPCTPERLPLSRSVSFESSDTPLRTGNNRSNQQLQLTPHKPKSGHSIKRKLSSNRGKLYSDGDTLPEEASDENRNGNDLNDSLDCKRLDISPIPKVKRHKPNENISNMMRSSTPKTASSQPRTLSLENSDTEAPDNRDVPPVRKLPLRKFQSFSPSKILTNRQKSSFRSRHEDATLGKRLVGRRGDVPMMRNNPPLELTPTKRTDGHPIGGYVTPSKEQRVLVELNPQAPMNLAGLINGPILEHPTTTTTSEHQLPPADAQLEQAVITVPTCEDFSITPAKVNLNDPELSSCYDESSLSFPSDDFVARRASNFSYGPTLNSILEEESPIRAQLGGIGAKLSRTPPSSCKSASGRIPKRLGTNSSGSLKSPLPKGARVPASPKALRKPNASLQPNHYPGMYCGREHLNVLKRLYEKNQDSLHILLDFLTDEDLVQVVKVSEGWKTIIQNLKPPKHWQRLQKFLALQKEDKENFRARSSLPILPPLNLGEPSPGLLIAGRRSGSFDGTKPAELVNPTPTVERLPGASAQVDESSSVVKRQPFKICNSRDSSIVGNCSSLYTSFGFEGCGNVTMPERRRRGSTTTIHSPPVSPSKVKFVANQKVASLLTASEQIRSCPRCGKPSRVIFASSSKNGQNKTAARGAVVAARLEKSYTLPDPETNNEFNGSKQNTLLSSDVGEASRNNNDYSANLASGHQPKNGSPDRVRKNLFNGSGSTSTRSRGQLIRSASVTTPTVKATPLVGTGRDNNPKKLRSGAKSVDCVSVPSSVPLSSANSVGPLESKCDYAICSRCEFHFCIKCRCQFHPDTVCFDLAPNSPSKEEERGQRNVACSRQSRRSLQRLCKR